MSDQTVDQKKRRFLASATVAAGAVGVCAAAVPFVTSLLPSAEAQAAGAPVTVNLKEMKPGDQKTVEWRGRPVWIVYRTAEMLQALLDGDSVKELRDPNSDVDQQPAFARNSYRSIKPEFLVLVGICTHLGCIPTYRPDPASVEASWPGGFFCSCHGSKFDLAGRVYKGVPAPINLEVPVYSFLDDDTLIIGEEAQAQQA